MKTRLIAKTFALFALVIFLFCSCEDEFWYDSDYNNGNGYDTAVNFSRITTNGSSTQTTTQITLYFDKNIYGFSSSDISLSGIPGITKGSLTSNGYSSNGYNFTLSVSGFTAGGTLSVAVSKSGYAVSGSPKTVTIYYYVTPTVTFESVKANGSDEQATTQLKLTFSQTITGLAASDITLSGITGVTKGTLSGGTDGTYNLPISGFTKGGTLTVAVAKSGYTITGSPQTVTIYCAAVTLTGVDADGSSTQTTTEINLTFDTAIEGLAASDITLSGVTGVVKGTVSGSNPYNLPISGFTSGGTLSVSVAKTGYTVSGSPKTVTIYYYREGQVAGSTGIEMVSISAGTFTMGSPTSESNRDSDETQHSVTLSAFSMSKYQVTQAQWIAVMGTGEDRTTATYGKGDNYPVYYVSWYDALVFCNKLSIKEGLDPVYSISGKTNPADWGTIPTSSSTTWDAAVMDKSKNGYRLPTEAEWEYACRAGTTTAYNTGSTISDSTGWYTSNSGSKAHEVGLKTANAWGLYDMHGNVWEWCWDWYGSYSTGAQTNPVGSSSGSYRVLRGGCWGNSTADYLRSARRGNYSPYSRSCYYGFRLVRSS